MALPPVQYDSRIPWRSRKTNYAWRPYAEITVHGKNGIVDRWFALIDTGADDLVLPSGIARRFGIDLSVLKQVSVQTAAGYAVIYKQTTIEIELEGRKRSVDVLFGPTRTPLIGRNALLKLIKFGIDLNGWLYADP